VGHDIGLAASLHFSDDFTAAGFPEISAFASDVRLVN